jgi:hypothetical protein
MVYTALQNTKEREEQYINAINFYLTQTKYKIVFCNNSGEDISSKITGDKNRIEFISFYGNDYDKSLGKGYGEFLILKPAFQCSELLKTSKYIIKITGRLIVNNIADVLKFNDVLLCYPKNKIYVTIQDDIKSLDSRCFIATKKFFKLFLITENSINDTQGYYFEHLLYDVIQQHKKSFLCFDFCLPLAFCGVSGSTKQLYNSEKKSFLYNLVDVFFYEIIKPQYYKNYTFRFYWVWTVSFIIRLQKNILKILKR